MLNWTWIEEQVSLDCTVYGVQIEELGMQSEPEVGKLLQKACNEFADSSSKVLIP